jgi:hypothetical protein
MAFDVGEAICLEFLNRRAHAIRGEGRRADRVQKAGTNNPSFLEKVVERRRQIQDASCKLLKILDHKPEGDDSKIATYSLEPRSRCGVPRFFWMRLAMQN